MSNDSEAVHEDSEGLHETWVSIQEAARILGISERAVHMRVKAGTLARRQNGRRVLIAVQTSQHPQETSEAVHEGLHEDSEVVHESNVNALVEQLRSENAFLRGQIEAANVEKAEMRRLMMADKSELQELRQKVALLLPAPSEPPQTAPAGPETTQTAEDGTDSTPRKWWQIFRRDRQ